MISRENQALWMLLPLLTMLIRVSAAATWDQDLSVSSSCQSHCGDVQIPYPFGVGKDCYLNKWYEIICRSDTSGKPVPFLLGINKEVVNISLLDDKYGRYALGGSFEAYGSVIIKGPITSSGCSDQEDSGSLLNLTGTPFYVSIANTLLAIGCNTKALMTHVEVEPSIVGCVSTCDATVADEDRSFCNGYRCCEATLPSSRPLQVVGVTTENINSTEDTRGGCKVAFLTNKEYFPDNISDPQALLANRSITVELRWLIAKADLSHISISDCYNMTPSYHESACRCEYGYVSRISYASCRCQNGYRGNPYISGGCKDIDECSEFDHSCGGHNDCVNTHGSYKCVPKKSLAIGAGVGSGVGLLMLVGGAYWFHKFIKKKKEINRRKKFFKRNGGLLLQKQLNSTGGNVEKTKIFNQRELEKATENFSLDRLLGQGGQGTVYKGMLVDGRIVAVKKSKVIDEDKLEEFINEVVILSQINHRNIVKLLGCCLETDVPLLVYEFIPNGNLFKHLHDGFDDYMMTWEARLRIAIEAAGALAYLHSSAGSPVYHRDIKSTNILLDEKYRAKVSDFGTSRSVAIDQTHLTTLIKGTFGYFDPEYFQSSRFTDKSDVYSYGVVLVELITGERPISNVHSEDTMGLAAHFIEALRENRLLDMVDDQIKEHSNLDQVISVAMLARKCLNRKGKKRPTMREVSMELERIQSSPINTLHVNIETDEDDEVVKAETEDSWNVVVSAPASEIIDGPSVVLDIEPLFPHQTW